MAEEQLELFKNEVDTFHKQILEYGKMYFTDYFINRFYYNKQIATTAPTIQRKLTFNNNDIIIELQQTAIRGTKKTRFLTETDEDIYNFLIYQYTKVNNINLFKRTQDHHRGILLFKMVDIFNFFNKKLSYTQIKESLSMLADNKIKVVNGDIEGIAPSLIEYFTYDNKKKIVAIKLSNGTINTIIENKNIITHYKELFELKNRIAKIIYKKLVIANIWTNEEEKILKPKSTIIEELQKYNIQYTNPKQKERLFKEIKEAVEELKEKNIIQSYRLIPVEDTARKNIITDYRMELKPTITFNKNHVMSQKLLKKLLPID